jgi:hypothetical protein
VLDVDLVGSSGLHSVHRIVRRIVVESGYPLELLCHVERIKLEPPLQIHCVVRPSGLCSMWKVVVIRPGLAK